MERNEILNHASEPYEDSQLKINETQLILWRSDSTSTRADTKAEQFVQR